MLCIVAIVDCTHVWSATASSRITLNRIILPNQTADILVVDKLQPPSDLIAVDQVRELHKQTTEL